MYTAYGMAWYNVFKLIESLRDYSIFLKRPFTGFVLYSQYANILCASYEYFLVELSQYVYLCYWYLHFLSVHVSSFSN